MSKIGINRMLRGEILCHYGLLLHELQNHVNVIAGIKVGEGKYGMQK